MSGGQGAAGHPASSGAAEGTGQGGGTGQGATDAAALRARVLRAHADMHAWAFDHALPFWAQAGRDAQGLGFHETLTLTGAPGQSPAKRMRVQARQIYVYSHAALLGWSGGLEAAQHGYAFMTAHGERGDGAWVRLLAPDGSVLDRTADLYDQAFVLFALAWYARATGEREPLDRARQTIAWVRAHMTGPGGRGYHNSLPPEAGHRQQNPHMHLLEATLALFETTRDAYYAEFAAELIALFRDHFFHAGSGTLGEFFTDDWSEAPGEAGTHVEPGHHFEWVWLLDSYGSLTGDRLDAEARALYRFAVAHGTSKQTGLVVDVLGRDGAVRRGSARLWPQTEALKAHGVMARGLLAPDAGGHGPAAAAAVERTADSMLARYFAGVPRGGWLDQFDAAGRPVSDRMPTSSFYHVFMGYAELDRLARAMR